MPNSKASNRTCHLKSELKKTKAELTRLERSLATEQGKTHARGTYQRNGEWYVLWYDHEGKRHREKAGTESNAKNLYIKRKAEALQGKKLPELNRRATVPITVAELLDRYDDHLKTVKPRSYREDKRHADYWKAELGSLSIEEVKPEHIERFRNRRLNAADPEQRVKPATVNRSVAFLKHIYNLAIQNNLTDRNPVVKIKMLQENNSRVRFLTDEEEPKLKAAVNHEHWLMIEFAYQTGLRQGEQFGPKGLRWDKVDFNTRIVTIPESKHGQQRHVHLNSRAIEIIKELQEKQSGPWVFQGARAGKPVATTTAYHLLQRACVRASIHDFHWHDLRHTFCSRLVMAGVDLRTVQELAGHKTITVTQRYAHLSPEHRSAAVERLVKPSQAPKAAELDADADSHSNSHQELVEA